MSSVTILLITFTCIFGGALIGILLRAALPEHHLRDDSKDVIKLGAGVIATLTALVLGLLVGSAKSSFDAVNTLIMQNSAKIITLDRALAQYGPETKEARNLLRNSIATGIEKAWPDSKDKEAGLRAIEASTGAEDFTNKIRDLKPANDSQRLLQSQALQLGNDLLLSHWLLIEQNQNELPTTFLVVLSCWLTILYTTYGLFTPRNATVIIVLLVCAFSMSSAIFLIVEMNRPFDGIIKVSSAPLLNALQHLGN